MNAKHVLRTATVMVAALVAGLLAVEGTWALWNVSVASGAQSVQAADFRVDLNGNPTIVDGSAVTVDLGEAGALVPGAAVHAAVNVTVPTNASAGFTVAATVGEPLVTNPSVAALSDSLRTQVAVAPTSGQCAEVATWSATATAVIAKSGVAGFCIRVELLSTAPESVRGATASISIPVSVNQK